MVVVSEGKGFHFLADSPKKRKKASGVQIEVPFGSGAELDQIESLMARIFLTDRDSLIALVPSYWQTCVSAGLNQVNDPKYEGCRFSTEMLSIPGMNAHADIRDVVQGKQSGLPQPETVRVFPVGNGISPPRQTYAPEPEFNSTAKALNLEGVVTLGLIVDDKGNPRNIEILFPFGAGLDEEAVKSVSNWKFKPAERDGHIPVGVKIAVEVDFHLH